MFKLKAQINLHIFMEMRPEQTDLTYYVKMQDTSQIKFTADPTLVPSLTAIYDSFIVV
jgi:hypothetical protein